MKWTKDDLRMISEVEEDINNGNLLKVWYTLKTLNYQGLSKIKLMVCLAYLKEDKFIIEVNTSRKSIDLVIIDHSKFINMKVDNYFRERDGFPSDRELVARVCNIVDEYVVINGKEISDYVADNIIKIGWV